MFGSTAHELQASHIDNHRVSDEHKRSKQLFLAQMKKPASNSAAVCEPEEETDEEEVHLIRGAVPQPADWLFAYENIQKFTSFNSSELKSRPHTTKTSKRNKRHISRKQLRSMVRVWGMRVRKRKLKWIKGTRSVCLGMDDRKSFKIIRFRCNAEIDFSPSYFAGGHCIDTGCRMGVLAGFNHLHGCDMEDDYASRTAERAIECIKDVFRSVYGDSLAEFNSFCQKVFGMVSDQALQKTCRLLKERYFHNCILIHRDPAHAVRIAMKHPLERNEEIIPVTNALFKGDHALLKDIRFSDVWQEKLKDCQRRVLQHDNVLGGDLQEIISTFNFLEPRFESFSRPLFTVICLLVPIVMMLTMIAEDVRDRDTKKQAEKVLRQMTFKFIINMGLSADYAETALRLVREFDVLAKDPATSRVLLEACRQKLHLLFQEGRIVKIPEAGKTAINLAMEQVQILDKLIACGDRTFNLYSESPTTVLAEGVRAFNEILDAAWGRLDADFRHNDLYMTFDVFHLSH